MPLPAFEALGLGPAVIAALELKGFEEPTTIQKLAIPRLLAPGPALIARARTGTGKTAAFGLPLVERLSGPAEGVRALVLVPTRELALQVAGEIVSLRSGARPRVAPIYGGAAIGEQLRRLSAGIDIVVGTPGRVLDHLDRGSLKLQSLEFLILDEADEMLDMGFIEDIETIMERANPERRTLLFSATMPQGILRIARKHLAGYELIEDATEAVTTELADQVWLEVAERDRLEALCRVIDSEEDFYGIVFTATRVEAERVARDLESRGYEAESLHGEISQDRRERVLGRFRERRARILVATDVAARGIDIDRLSHVVNWSLPHDPESYLHRVGRTGRAGNEGTAITFVTPEEYRKLFRFKHAAGSSLKKGSVPAIGDVLGAKRDRIRGRILARAESFSPAPPAQAVPSDGSAELPAADAPATAAVPAAPAAPAAPEKAKPRAKIGARKATTAAAPEGAHALWLAFADEILARLDPREALAASLFESFGAELDPARYREMQDVSVDAAATARLFVGSGRRDGATPRGLATLLSRLAELPDRLVGGIEIYEAFSFVTVPFEAAERVIAAARRSGGFPPVKLATPKGSGPLRSRGPGGPGGPGGYRREGDYPPRRRPYGDRPSGDRPSGDRSGPGGPGGPAGSPPREGGWRGEGYRKGPPRGPRPPRREGEDS